MSVRLVRLKAFDFCISCDVVKMKPTENDATINISYLYIKTQILSDLQSILRNRSKLSTVRKL